jgi:hypothetical protein
VRNGSERTDPLFDHAGEDSVKISLRAGVQDDKLLTNNAGCSFKLSHLWLGILEIRICEDGKDSCMGNQFAQQLQPLWFLRGGKIAHTRYVGTRPAEARDKAILDWIRAKAEDYRRISVPNGSS